MSLKKPGRAERERCRSMTTEELQARDKECTKASRAFLDRRDAVRRELRRRRSEQWSA